MTRLFKAPKTYYACYSLGALSVLQFVITGLIIMNKADVENCGTSNEYHSPKCDEMRVTSFSWFTCSALLFLFSLIPCRIASAVKALAKNNTLHLDDPEVPLSIKLSMTAEHALGCLNPKKIVNAPKTSACLMLFCLSTLAPLITLIIFNKMLIDNECGKEETGNTNPKCEELENDSEETMGIVIPILVVGVFGLVSLSFSRNDDTGRSCLEGEINCLRGTATAFYKMLKYLLPCLPDSCTDKLIPDLEAPGVDEREPLVRL